MKKMTVALALMLVILVAEKGHADSHGNALIPSIHTYKNLSSADSSTFIHLSNITNHDTECTLKLYDHNGTMIGNEDIEIYNGNNSGSVQSVDSDNVFSIPAHSTRRVLIRKTVENDMFGYGIIEWSSVTDNLSQALIGVVNYWHTDTNGRSWGTIPINNGQPF